MNYTLGLFPGLEPVAFLKRGNNYNIAILAPLIILAVSIALKMRPAKK